MREVKAFQCEFCSRYGKNKTRIRRHEEMCLYSPANQSCGSCGHLTDWSCRKGVVFIKEQGKQTPILRTNCPLYENREDMIYGPEEDVISN